MNTHVHTSIHITAATALACCVIVVPFCSRPQTPARWSARHSCLVSSSCRFPSYIFFLVCIRYVLCHVFQLRFLSTVIITVLLLLLLAILCTKQWPVGVRLYPGCSLFPQRTNGTTNGRKANDPIRTKYNAESNRRSMLGPYGRRCLSTLAPAKRTLLTSRNLRQSKMH